MPYIYHVCIWPISIVITHHSPYKRIKMIKNKVDTALKSTLQSNKNAATTQNMQPSGFIDLK